ncbi:phosphate-starvation-inducible PsiE family protein [Thiobacillus sp.]|uniref:phosphate-starvation-inducible PsiE family protein n=1 Tax=Thiobacillus sp. TaxID=924 RepID=UPI0025E7419A|nr:phosphate-starvation-inducible PsiE family protein [Thiobacillus sp.]
MNPAKDRLFARLALNVLGVFEAIGLIVITLATLVAGVFEVNAMIAARTVALGDLLLLFLYLEVLAMVGCTFGPDSCRCAFPSISPSWRWRVIWCWT